MPEHLGAQSAVERINHLPVETLVAESGKMKFLVELLDNLKAEGHRTLVFSMARRILDILERVMTERVNIILVSLLKCNTSMVYTKTAELC